MKESDKHVIVCGRPAIDEAFCPVITDKKKIEESYLEYGSDESKSGGAIPDRLYFPRSTEETAAAVRDIIRGEGKATTGRDAFTFKSTEAGVGDTGTTEDPYMSHRNGMAIRISGSRTGIVGGAVVQSGECVISLEKVACKPRFGSFCPSTETAADLEAEKAPAPVTDPELETAPTPVTDPGLERKTITVGAGVTLGEISSILRDLGTEDWYYPVDPTEMSASVGGTVATNASGARTLYFGPTRDWVAACTVILADGSIIKLRRGEQKADDGQITLVGADGEKRSVLFDPVTFPTVKHTGGYYLQPNMDLIDLFIGSEGTLGIVTEVELLLRKRFTNNLHLCLFLPKQVVLPIVREIQAISGESSAKQARDAIGTAADTTSVPALSEFPKLLAMEYMDSNSVRLLREYRHEAGESSGVPVIPDLTDEVLYTEWGYDSDEALEFILEQLETILGDRALSLDDTWAGFTEQDLNKMKLFRHALPERINTLVAERKKTIPSLTKISTDMAVPLQHRPQIMKLYNDTLTSENLEYYIFGHIGNGHLHINILPRTEAERIRALEVYRTFARAIVPLGGSVSAEHGIGRMKKSFVPIQYSSDEIETMREIKRFFDPENRLNPGVLFV